MAKAEPTTQPTNAAPQKCRHIRALVEGYEDVAFWRAIFDPYESDNVRFEVSVPPRKDLAKGKKTLLADAAECHPELIMCMDSDFDYLFADQTDDARIINSSPYMFHTYVYSTENFLCYAPSLHNLCVKATKNDAHIFDFEEFMARYSRIIYPAFVWYAYSAQMSTPNIFTLTNFKNTVRLGYLDLDREGAATLEWLQRQVDRRLAVLEKEHPEVLDYATSALVNAHIDVINKLYFAKRLTKEVFKKYKARLKELATKNVLSLMPRYKRIIVRSMKGTRLGYAITIRTFNLMKKITYALRNK